jgi:putative flavoprotein involved in K+ transport
MADYLEAYARRFNLPVRTGVRVQRLFKRGARYVVAAEGGIELEAAQVIVAMAKYQHPKIPAFAESLASDDHSAAFDRTIATQVSCSRAACCSSATAIQAPTSQLELARTGRETWLAGATVGEVPFRPDRFWGRNVLGPCCSGFVFGMCSPSRPRSAGRPRRAILAKGAPRIRVKSRDLVAAGVRPRAAGQSAVRDGQPVARRRSRARRAQHHLVQRLPAGASTGSTFRSSTRRTTRVTTAA